VEHEIKILKHKPHGKHNDHCIAIAKGVERIRNRISNAIDKCVSKNMDEAINVEEKIERSTKKFLTKTENAVNEAAQCAAKVIHNDAIVCLNNVST
jgi:hypothetical protein